MWILLVLLGLVILVGMLLCVPIDLLISINTYQAPLFQANLQWFSGLFRKELTTVHKEKQDPQTKSGEKKHRKAASLFNIAGDLIKVNGLFPAVTRFLLGIIRQVKIKELSAHFKVGLEDPADTGILSALVSPLSGYMRYRFHHDVDIQPVFDGDLIIEGQAHSKISIMPIRIIAVTLGFIFSIPLVKVIKIIMLER